MAATLLKSLRVLVAEDNPVNQMFAARLVERQGHSARVVSNGQLALEALQRETFDVVLMDIGMPLMDGFEAVRQLRQLEKLTGCHQPVIAMTASATSLDRDRCLDVGMDDFVGKPVQAADLATAMARVLQVAAQPCADIRTPYPVDPGRNETSVCDLTAAIRRLDGDLSFLKQLVQLFLDTIPAQLQSLETAIRDRNRNLIGDLAHSIKGSVRHFFADSAYEFAQRLEIISLSGDSVLIEQTYEQLLQQVGRLQTELLSILFLGRETSSHSGVS